MADPELDDADLFGSDDETAAAPPAPPAAPEGAPTAARGPEDGAGDEDDVSEKDLFGSEDDGEELDEAELFGSGDEGEAARPAGDDAGEPAAATPLPPPSEISEMDERDIFGDVSDEDDEPEKEEDCVILMRPAPPPDRAFVSLRLPNVLSVEKTSYRGPDSIPQSQLEGYKEFKNTRGQNVVKLLNPENCLRWRFKKAPDGGLETDDIGRPKYESNTRIVEWEDGSRTLFVGTESFSVDEVDERNALFEENNKDVYVCHGIVRKRLVVTPRNMASDSHEMLKRSQYRKYEPVRRSLLMTVEEQDQARQLLDLEKEDRKRREAQSRKMAAQDAALPGMSVGFLEDDDTAEGPSIADLKRQYGMPGARPAKRAKSEGSPASGPASSPR
eukprot:gb/GFBE01048103.1/.p1 GENE.gb/GFBE01048103.1/~~gb/GFBE01048103.1/.p1  ORF type:complete len:387 (+),score=93.30 gb/GFBE01048103.1/:1-1161(+)